MKTTFHIIFLIVTATLSAQEKQKVDVFFDFNRYNLNDTAIEKLDLSVNGNALKVTRIYGYCDWKGTNAYNDSLSLKRVRSVYNYLKDKGITIKKDYEIKGFGEDFMQSKVQAENRKVTIVFEFHKIPDSVSAEETLTAAVKNSRKGDKIKLKNINFHNNSAVIVNKSKPTLYELLCIMEENLKLKIEIQGHICCQSQADVNDVSTARARAIYNFLVRNKINRKRLAFKGFGISQPIHPIPEKTEAQADENRRVEIMIVEI